MKRKSAANCDTAGKEASEHRYYENSVKVVVNSVLNCLLYMTNGMRLIPYFQVQLDVIFLINEYKINNFSLDNTSTIDIFSCTIKEFNRNNKN